MINDDRTTNVDDLLIPQPADSGAKTAAQTRQQLETAGHSHRQIAINDGSANFADFSLTPTSPPQSSSSTARSAPSTAVRRNRPASTSRARSTAMRR
jgi:hypothetical protein